MFPKFPVLHLYAFHCTTTWRLGPSGFVQKCSYSIATPPTTTASPPAIDQSGTCKGPAAADLGEAVLAGLEVAVLLVELVLETDAVLKKPTLVATSLGSIERGIRCYVHELELDEAASPPLIPPVSPLPLEPTGV